MRLRRLKFPRALGDGSFGHRQLRLDQLPRGDLGLQLLAEIVEHLIPAREDVGAIGSERDIRLLQRRACHHLHFIRRQDSRVRHRHVLTTPSL
jgi:hypothetical protein